MKFGHDTGGGQDDWTQQSDHGPFHSAGIPFVYLGVEDHADYHKPTDTAEKIDPGFLGGVAAFVIDAVAALDSGAPALQVAWPAPALLALKPELDRLYDQFNLTHSTRDPIWTVRRFQARDDQEIVAFLASALAFGRVQSVLQTVDAVLGVMEGAPASFVTRLHAAIRRRGSTAWATAGSAAAIWRRSCGCCIRCFATTARSKASSPPVSISGARVDRGRARVVLDPGHGARPEGDLRPRAVPTPGVGYFFSRPSSGGACKRLNLFLRWIVRHDAVDLGLWEAVRPAQLVVPLDTHIIRVGSCLGMTRRASPGWRMAIDVTRGLRQLNPDDPVRYDFSMCHLGMGGSCGFGTTRTNAQCPLHGVCRPARRRKAR